MRSPFTKRLALNSRPARSMNATGARKIFAILALTLAVNALASEIPAEFQEPVHVAGQLGMTLYVMDSAASRASDRLVEDGIANPDRAIQGWLTSVDEDKRHVSVVFVGTQEAVPVALYMVDVPLMAGEMKVKTFREPVPLKGSLLNLWQARQLATKSLEARDDLCANTTTRWYSNSRKEVKTKFSSTSFPRQRSQTSTSWVDIFSMSFLEKVRRFSRSDSSKRHADKLPLEVTNPGSARCIEQDRPFHPKSTFT